MAHLGWGQEEGSFDLGLERELELGDGCEERAGKADPDRVWGLEGPGRRCLLAWACRTPRPVGAGGSGTDFDLIATVHFSFFLTFLPGPHHLAPTPSRQPAPVWVSRPCGGLFGSFQRRRALPFVVSRVWWRPLLFAGCTDFVLPETPLAAVCVWLWAEARNPAGLVEGVGRRSPAGSVLGSSPECQPTARRTGFSQGARSLGSRSFGPSLKSDCRLLLVVKE